MAGEVNLVIRKRKAHIKSRQGCRNCKLRRVKCDEKRPKCKKCSDFGVICNFAPNVPDLEMCANGPFNIERPEPVRTVHATSSQLGTRKMDISKVLYPAVQTDLNIDKDFLDRFTRFNSRTVLSMGTPEIALKFQSISTQLAFSHPYLMHVTQTLTVAHDRYLSPLPLSITSKQTAVESYHLSRAAALLNEKLSSTITPEDCDPLWAAAALLGIVSFATIEASTPEEAWPMKPTEPSDFEWINMSEHKTAVWNLMVTMKPDTVATLKGGFTSFSVSIPDCGVDSISPQFIKLYELNESSSGINSPYFTAVHKIARLMHIECERASFPRFLGFIGHMQPEFKILVCEKDPRALLLTAYWYSMVGKVAWHLERRSMLQGRATCLYLEKYHPDDVALHELLEYPKMRLDLWEYGGLPTPPEEQVLVQGDG